MSAGQRIKVAREAKGWTQNDLTKAAGLSEGLISRLERGERNLGTRASEPIARALGVRREWLLSGEGDMWVANPTTLPNRDKAAQIAREGGIEPAAVDAVLAWTVPDAEAKSTLWWVQAMQLQHLMTSGQAGASLPPPTSTPRSTIRRRRGSAA